MDREDAEQAVLDAIVAAAKDQEELANNAADGYQRFYHMEARNHIVQIGAEIANQWGWSNIPELGI